MIENTEEREAKLRQITSNAQIIIITGKRGGGKSALGYRILETCEGKERYCVGLREDKWKYLPNYIIPLTDLTDLPQDAIIFIDEAATMLYARDYFSSFNKFISKLITETRHKDQLLIFATHTLRKLDIGVIIDADALLFKEPSFLHSKFERAEVRDILKKVEKEFNSIKGDRRAYTYVLSHDFDELITNKTPSFWCEELSKATKVASPDQKPYVLKKLESSKFTVRDIAYNPLASFSDHIPAAEYACAISTGRTVILYDEVRKKELTRITDGKFSNYAYLLR